MKEVSTIKCNVPGHNPQNSSWIVLREDDRDFAEVAAEWPEEVREVLYPEHYITPDGGQATRYDFNGTL